MQKNEMSAGEGDPMDALHLILAAWEEGTDAGIPPELMAYAAIYTALSDLVAMFGEENVAMLTSGLSDRVRTGEFTHHATRQ
jgi:ketol-acid reductoisomerase